MPFTIHLDNPLPLYSGNEIIRGRVIFECTRPIDIGDIRVSFSGHAMARIQKVKGSAAPSATYTSKCTLFEKERILISLSGATLVPATYEWGFQFEFPSNVLSAANWPDKLPFRSDANHLLPPTFMAEVEDSLRRLKCSINYEIRAQVFKPQKGFWSKKSVFDEQIRLPFIAAVTWQKSPSNSSSTAYLHEKEQLFTVRSLLILPENRGRSLTFQEKFQSWISPSQLPRFDFQASLSYHTRIVQSAPLELILRIAPLMEYSSVGSIPEILLQSLSIKVVSRTAARAAPSLMGAISGEVDDTIEILSKSSIGLALCSQTNLGNLFGPLVFKKSDVSFSTFNISRSYRLCVVFTFECGGKHIQFSLLDLPIELEESIFSTKGRSETLGPNVSRQMTGYPDAALDETYDFPPSYTSASTEKRTGAYE